MVADGSWKLLGASSSPAYRFFDWLRSRVNHRLSRFLARELSGRRECRVLEAGSGPGGATSLLRRAPAVACAAALDWDHDALRAGRRRDASLTAVVADLARMPFGDSSFDLVWNSSTLEHLPNAELALREMARVCKPGGLVFVGVPYRWGPLGLQRLVARTAVGRWIGRPQGRRELDRLLRRAGLRPAGSFVYGLRLFVGATGRRAAAVAMTAVIAATMVATTSTLRHAVVETPAETSQA
jgi:SAM-dependent methyltransferase